MSNVNSEKLYVASYKELITTFLIFSIILFMLYPKDLIKEQIISEQSNYDLSMLYLTDMLKNDPTNESLMLILATQSLRSGKKDVSYKLLKFLRHSKDNKIRSQAYRQSYILTQENYYYAQDHNDTVKQAEAYHTLQYLFKTILHEKFYKKDDNAYLVKASLFLHNTQSAYKYALKTHNTIKVKNFISLYFLCMELKKPKEATRALEVLIKIDRKEDKKWKDTLYYVLSKDYSKQNTLKILEKKSKKSRYWLIKLAQYNFSVKEYREASTVYMELFSSEQNPHKKTTYFYKAIESLNAGKYPQYAVALAKSQESYYFDNPKVRRYILRLYIGNAALKNAAILSLKILKEYQ